MTRRRHTLVEAPDAMLRRLEAAVGSDQRAAVSTRRGQRGCAASIVGFLLLLVAWVVVGNVAPPVVQQWMGRLLVCSALAGLVVTLGFHVHGWLWNVDDRKLQTALRLVRLLRADLPSREKARLELDFRGFTRGRRVKRTGGFFSSRKKVTYEHTWLRFEATLADRSVLRLQMTDRVDRKSKSKRKYTQRREKMTTEIDVAVRPGKSYGDVAAAAAARLARRAKPPYIRAETPEARGRTLRAHFVGQKTSRTMGRRGHTSGELGSSFDARDLVNALRWTYAGLAPGKKR
jgi:hypothetical protein